MRTRDYTLSDNEVAVLERMIREETRPPVVRRATAVRMLHLGHNSVAVGRLLLVSSASVRQWFERFRSEGKSGLEDRPRAGRPRQATEGYWQVIDEALQSDPQGWGYAFTIWTLERLRDHAQRLTGKRLNAAYLSEQMKARDYVYRRPKHDLRVHQDATARAEAEQVLEGLKKTPNAGRLSSSLWTKVR